MQPNYANTKLKAWFMRLVCHPARKRGGSILNRHTPGNTQGTVHVTPVSRQCLISTAQHDAQS